MADSEKEAQEVATQMKNMEAQLETIQKTLASVEKAQIRSNEEEKEVGKSYSFVNARKDIAMGKVAKAPLWDIPGQADRFPVCPWPARACPYQKVKPARRHSVF